MLPVSLYPELASKINASASSLTPISLSLTSEPISRHRCFTIIRVLAFSGAVSRVSLGGVKSDDQKLFVTAAGGVLAAALLAIPVQAQVGLPQSGDKALPRKQCLSPEDKTKITDAHALAASGDKKAQLDKKNWDPTYRSIPITSSGPGTSTGWCRNRRWGDAGQITGKVTINYVEEPLLSRRVERRDTRRALYRQDGVRVPAHLHH